MDPTEVFITACQTNNFGDWLNICEDGSFDLNGPVKYHNKFYSPLFVAVSELNASMVRLLLEKGANVNTPQQCGVFGGCTVLDRAIFDNSLEIVKILLEFGAEGNPTGDSFGYALDELAEAMYVFTAFDEATIRDVKKIVIILCEREINRLSLADQKDEQMSKYYQLCQAIVEEDSAEAKVIIESLEAGDFKGIMKHHQPLVFATWFHQNDFVKALLDKGSDVVESLEAAVYVRNLSAVKFCLESVNDEDEWSERANEILAMACTEGFLEVVQFLIAEGESLCAEEYVARITDTETFDTREVMRYLLESPDAIIDVPTCSENLIEFASSEDCDGDGSVYALLLEYGADPNFPKMKESSTHFFCQNQSECHVLSYFRKMSLIDEKYANERIWTLGLGEKEWAHMKSDETEDYVEEIDNLRKIILNVSTSLLPQWSLYDLMVIEPMHVARLMRNVNLQRIYEENDYDFRENYPFYGTILNIKYEKGLERRNLIDSAAELLCEAAGCELTEEIIDNVFKHFSNNHLVKWDIMDIE